MNKLLQLSRFLLCTDLDRTLLPNGSEPESDLARKKFRELVKQPQVTLVYVTGRHQQLVEQAITEYQLPQADFVIADVGSTIYSISNSEWCHLECWDKIIDADWGGNDTSKIQHLLNNIKDIHLQEPSKQNKHKLSYYVPLNVDYESILVSLKNILNQHSIATNLIWSVDQITKTGLLDILPASAGKHQSIEFLKDYLDFNYSNTVFAGDSGNDICVLSSPIQSVLVANADDEVRDAAVKQAEANHQRHTLYLAKGDFLKMNGNYSAGILEGIAHYMPQAEDWLRGET